MEIKALYDKRTFTGQLAAQKKHFAEELISYPEAPDEPVSASDLIRQQQDILARNGENQRLRAQYAELERQEQQCVDALKEQDKFDEAAQRIAYNRALTAAKKALTQETIKFIKETFGDLDSYLKPMIEAQVRSQKTYM